ncbi:MAG: hypothetical protein OSA99_21480, partial [Acidimicrobiales bacterium]|nr:hypothetical protein [Acidimicrobiales bacterium]
MRSEAESSAEAETEAAPIEGGRFGLGAVLFLLTMAWAAGIASYPLTDNSFLTHLATGRIILDEGSVPTTDPYTFTAPGVDWTVQSWLPSIVYAVAERAGGVLGLRVVVLVFYLVAAWLLWRLSRPCASLVLRAALLFATLYIVTDLWGERPYMVGVIGLGLVWLSLDRELPLWSLVPMFWVWANSHGSFPLGIGLVVLVVVGRKLDGREVSWELSVLKWSVIGTLAAVIGPLGPKVLLFPLTALTKSDVLSEIVEWQPATYQTTGQRVFLILVMVAVLSLVRNPSWALALPTVVFVAAAVVAQRNIVMALMVLVPVVARSAPSFGEIRASTRPTLIRPYVAIGAASLLLAGSYAASQPFGDLSAYPQHALAWAEVSTAESGGVAAPDIVGNLLGNLDGPRAAVFVDDRVDMLPDAIVEASLILLRGEPRWAMVLDRYDIDVVVWPRERPLSGLLAAHAD